ncbi:MAG: gamma-glutamylcyclotransferase [Chloroflexi bacterium]|nr:MAG: gamma-glutamylcyclotransferase [Chloroflexota bacterium]
MYYFAYGSNLSLKQMAERCPGSQPRFRAVLPNYTLAFAGWSRRWRGGTATIRRSAGDRVPGAVYEISARDLLSLDEHEGYPAVYDRMNVKVITEDDEFVDAVTYINIKHVSETPPSPEYLAVIQQGYKDWGISSRFSIKGKRPPRHTSG